MLATFLAASCVLSGAETSLPQAVIEKIESVIVAEKERLQIPGISVACAADNELCYERGFGLADLENSVPARAHTAYRTASIAKSLTATAVMQLAEKGLLDLDAPIQEFCPAWPEKPWPLTARQLLGHLGGIRHYQAAGESAGTQHFYTLTDSLALFKDDPLLHEPGSKYSYTTYGYSVLGCAIEGASAMPFADYMRTHVFEKARMQRTCIDDQLAVVPDRAHGYAILDQQSYDRLPPSAKSVYRPGQLINCSLHDTSMKVPGGGLLSTAPDLVRFAIALVTGRLVEDATREDMWTSQKTADDKNTGYGLGFELGRLREERLITHSGGQAGTSTLLWIIPARRIAVAAMCNLQGAPLEIIVRHTAETLLAKAGE